MGSATIHKVKVKDPEGEIKVQVYRPTEESAEGGGLRTAEGLPAHVNYHGGEQIPSASASAPLHTDGISQEVG